LVVLLGGASGGGAGDFWLSVMTTLPSSLIYRDYPFPVKRSFRLTNGSIIGTISTMASNNKIIEQMRREPANVRFVDLMKICEEYFGKPRSSGSSHTIFKTPWQGDPRINIQRDGDKAKAKAKAYQVKQVLLAIEKLESMK
jgi:hypothetical protein